MQKVGCQPVSVTGPRRGLPQCFQGNPPKPLPNSTSVGGPGGLRRTAAAEWPAWMRRGRNTSLRAKYSLPHLRTAAKFGQSRAVIHFWSAGVAAGTCSFGVQFRPFATDMSTTTRKIDSSPEAQGYLQWRVTFCATKRAGRCCRRISQIFCSVVDSSMLPQNMQCCSRRPSQTNQHGRPGILLTAAPTRILRFSTLFY